MGSHKITKILNSNFWTSAGASPSSGTRLGAGVCSNLRLLPPLGRFKSRAQSSASPHKLARLTSASVFAPTLALAIAVLGISFFSQTAYAASYINVSSGSGGTVSLGSIKPSATGASASGSDTLTITTNCSAGYSVYVSAQNGGDTNLTNTNSSVTSNNTISASSTAVGSTATALSSNTWGITGDSASASASKYVGLPSYADATNTALISNSSASTTGDNKSTVYYGVKVDTTLSPGTYSGDVLYTTLVSDKCNNYTVHFNANGGTGSMSDQTIPVGTATPLTANGFTRSGYAFLGWSTSASGKTGTATNGIGTESDVDYRDGQSVTDIASFNSTVNLYAIWLAVDGDMQSFSTCANLSVGESKLLRDTRDNKAYAIKKLPDGKCWMMQNLTIGMNGAQTLTVSNTNIDDGKTYYLPPAGKQGSGTIDEDSTLTATDTANFETSPSGNDPHAKTQFRTKGSDYDSSADGYANDSDTGYYNFYTATLGFSSHSDDKTSGSSTRDICPKGWRLPWTSDSGTTRTTTADSYVLATSYNTDASWSNVPPSTSNPITTDITIQNSMYISAASPLATTSQNKLAGFSYAGFWLRTDSSAIHVGTVGAYWSSSIYKLYEDYYLYLGPSGFAPQSGDYMFYGRAVRCLARYDYLISYSSDGSDSGEPNKTSDDAVLTSDSVTMPTQGTLAKDGYEFKGWALTSGASDATYTAEQTVSVSDLITAASSAGQTTAPGSTITLYPVWVQSVVYMQNWSGCSALATNEYLTLRDSRDNNDYVVKKLADGKCWMVQNLRLKNYKLTSADSDVTDDFALAASTPTPSGSTWCTNDSSACDDQSLAYYNPSEASSDNNSSYYGALYNWYTATAGTGTYSTGSEVSAASSICPKGWHLPKGSFDASTNEFSILDIAWGGDGENRSNANTYSDFTGTYKNDNNGGFGLAGYIFGSVTGAGSDGRYWSSTAGSHNTAISMALGSDMVGPQNNQERFRGYSVRCISSVYSTMQDFNASTFSTTIGASAILKDARDGKLYAVKRLPDGKVWMMQNLTINGVALTPDDTNIDNGTTYYLPKDGGTGSITDSSTKTATTGYNFVNGQDDKAMFKFRSKNPTYTNDSDTGYYNFYAATLGYSYYQESGSGAGISQGSSTRDICPKGWRLPKTPSTGKSVNTIGVANDFTNLARSYNANSWSGTSTDYSYFTNDSTVMGSMYKFIASPLATTIQNNFAGFFYSGYWIGADSSASGVGQYGYYWSSSIYNANDSYYLQFRSSYLFPQSVDHKYHGYAVRCIAK